MKPSPLVAFGACALGIAIFSAMDAVMKGLVLAIGVYAALLWRTVATLVLTGVAWGLRAPLLPTRTAMRLHVVRSIVTLVMALLFFWGLARVPMAQAIALAYIAPLLSLFLAAMLLGERIRRTTLIAAAVASGGIGVILFGQSVSDMGDDALAGAIAILVSAIFYAWNIVLMRQQALVAGPVEIAFFQSLVIAILLACAYPWVGRMPDAAHWPAVVLGAILAAMSLVLLSWGYARAEASYLAPTEYTGFLWATLFGFVVFGEVPSPYTIAGAALIVGACAVAIRRPRDSDPVLEAALP
ncbi:MAG: DMT family transporter [Pseudomonadota bacterium]